MHGEGQPSENGPEALRILASHPDPAARCRAAGELGGIGDSHAIEALVHALRDPGKGVRAAAATALASVGPPAVGALAAALADGDWVVRYRAAEALGKIRDARAVTALIRALGDERDHVRYMAAKGLGNLGERRAIGPLIGVLADENPFVRRAAREALCALR